MSSERKARFSELGYGRFIWIGIIVILTVVAKGITNFALLVMNRHCGVSDQYYWFKPAPASACFVSDAYFTWYIAIIVAIIGLVVAIWAASERDYWYREVLKGTIVGFSWYSESGFYSSGYQAYYISVKGRTRQDEVRVYRHSVQPKTYHDFKKGQYIDFS
jgi:hypothetical protein